MVSAEEFEWVRREICASGPPSGGDDLLGMELDFWAYMGDEDRAGDQPVPWEGMSVGRSPGTDWLIRGSARGRSDESRHIAAALSRIWTENLRYSHREAHRISISADAVCLQAVTQIGPQRFWVTAEVRVGLS